MTFEQLRRKLHDLLHEFFSGIDTDVNISDDKSYIEDEKKRYVPFSVDPFQDEDGAQKDGASEKPPIWLELAGDLAWTASFSSLTSNTTVTEPLSVWNYGIFFALTWHLWATQATYDIKYYTNDWWHRILFAFQLGIYAALAAFSGSFNVGWEISSKVMNPFVGDTTELTGQAIREDTVDSMVTTFRGVNIILFFSRLLLFAQYFKVLRYRWKRNRKEFWKFCIPAASTLLAAFLFLFCFGMAKQRKGNGALAITQLSFWAVGIAIQAGATAKTPKTDPSNCKLKSKNAMAPRLENLTVIIMGEGLNRICGTLRHSINALGFTPPMIMQAISMLVVLYLLWFLYFDGFETKNSSNKDRDVAWLWTHFPFHFCLIMMLEGVKNLFLYANVNEAIDLLVRGFDEVVGSSANLTAWPEHPRLETLLLPLKMSWEQEVTDVVAVGANATGDRLVTMKAQLGRWSHTVLHNTYLFFNEQPDPEADLKFHKFLSNNDTTVLNDMDDNLALRDTFIDRYNKLMAYSGHWVIAISGILLIFMAIINYLRSRPQNRFSWRYILNRGLMGLILIIVGGSTSHSMDNKRWLFWIIPTIAMSYFIAVAIDLSTLRVSMRSIKRHGWDQDPDPQQAA